MVITKLTHLSLFSSTVFIIISLTQCVILTEHATLQGGGKGWGRGQDRITRLTFSFSVFALTIFGDFKKAKWAFITIYRCFLMHCFSV